MSAQPVTVQRPQRWDTPFSAEMTNDDVDRLMELPPFCRMDEGSFSKKLPLRGILKNDCRINRYQTGDIVIRQGDYGNSAFLILDGSALVSLAPLPAEVLGRPAPSRTRAWLETVIRFWTRPRVAEACLPGKPATAGTGTRGSGPETRVFVQDISGTLDLDQAREMPRGELFGELAALTRTPRSATVLAGGPAEMLEMRWQGLRDLMRKDAAIREYVECLYRQNSLRGHLQQTPVLCELSPQQLQQVADDTEFQSFGNFEWNRQYKSLNQLDVADKIQAEPVIARQGDAADGLILIRNGFARLSRQYGNGHQTIAYLGKGQSFGLREMAHNWRANDERGWTLSLRAVGYVDILRIPQLTVEQHILPHVPSTILPPPLPDPEPIPATGQAAGQAPRERRMTRRQHELETGLLEFLVENRFMNGTQAMLIDLDRCTRCDDCVRACAATHDNNPRFVRQGPRHENWMIASACMHCADPVCMIGCPTGAIGRDETSGNISINDQSCIGCGTCAASCPYSNIRMVDIRDRTGTPIVDQQHGKTVQKATKCDFCSQIPGGPACQNACPHDALTRIDLTTPLPLYQLTLDG